MDRLQSRVRTDSDEFRANRAAMEALVRGLTERRAPRARVAGVSRGNGCGARAS